MKNSHFKYTIVENKNMIIITLMLYSIIGILCNFGNSKDIQVLKTYEMFLLPFAACWVIYSFWDYVDKNSCEIFLSYPKSRLVISFSKITCMLVLYILVYSILFLISFSELEMKAVYYLGTITEIIFWSSAGYYLVIGTRNMILSIAVIWIYTAAQILDVEKYFAFIAVYFYPYDTISEIITKGGILLVFSVILLFAAQKKFNHMKL